MNETTHSTHQEVNVNIGTAHWKNNFSVFSLEKYFYLMCAYSQLILLTVFTIICNHGGGVPHCKNNFSLFSLEQILTPVYDKKNWWPTREIWLLTLLTMICTISMGTPHCKYNFSVFSLEQNPKLLI